MEGWIKMHRKLLESEIWIKKPSSWFKIWQYILLSVNHKDVKFYKKGTNFFNWTELIKNRSLGRDITINNVEHCMKFLKSAEQIAAQKTTRGVVITVLNYHKYNPEAEIAAEEKRNRSGTINKNDKNDKNLLTNVSKGGNPEIELILSTYKETFGHSPTDKYPRRVAQNLRQVINSLVKDLNKDRPDLGFKEIVDRTFKWYDKTYDMKGDTLDVVKRKARILFDSTRTKYKIGVKQP